MEFILPLLFLLVGLGSIFYDREDQNLLKRYGFGILIILAFISICGLEINEKRKSIEEKKELEQKNRNLNKDIKEQTKTIGNLNKDIKEQKETIENLQQIIDDLKDLIGEAPEVIKRDREERRSKIQIFYFKRQNENDVQLLLNKLTSLEENYKFKVDDQSTCQGNDCSFKTNMIVFGTEVNLDDVEFIAKKISESKVKIQVIRQFYNPINKENVVHIGYEESLCNTWTKNQIKKISRRSSLTGNGCPID